MTRGEFAARKRQIAVIAGIGIFSLLCSFTLGFVEPNGGQLAILLTAVFLGCIFVAGRMAFKLKKESAAK
jgi:hypothetical protein